MKTFIVDVHYKTLSGKHGSRRQVIKAEDEDKAIAKAEHIIKKMPGRIITGGDCVEKKQTLKIYRKTHKDMHVAYKHIEKLKARGAKTEVESKGNKVVVKYWWE